MEGEHGVWSLDGLEVVSFLTLDVELNVVKPWTDIGIDASEAP